MKRFFAALTVVLSATVTWGQTDFSKVYGTYDGKLYVGIGSAAACDAATPRTGKLVLSASDKPECIHVEVRQFQFGVFTCESILVKDVPVIKTAEGLLLQAVNDRPVEGQLRNSKGQLLTATMSASVEADKSTITTDSILVELAVLYEGRKIYLRFRKDATATGIENIRSLDEKTAEIYDWSGRRVSRVGRGAHIVNGRKVLP